MTMLLGNENDPVAELGLGSEAPQMAFTVYWLQVGDQGKMWVCMPWSACATADRLGI